MKIFVSSVMSDFEEYREAAFAAIRSLDHDIISAEDFPSSTSSSRVACMQGVREADLVVLILGARYGWDGTASGLSPTHEEFREAKENGKALPFIQTRVEREAEQQAFVSEVEDYDTGMHRGRTFRTPDELRTEITRAVNRHQLSAATTPVDVAALVDAAHNIVPEDRQGFVQMSGPLLHVAVVGGPTQTIIRPSEIERQALIDELVADLTSSSGYFSYRNRTEPRLEQGALVIEQDKGAAFRIDEAGSLLLSVPIEQAPGHIKPLIEENVAAAIGKALAFADRTLEKFDHTQKLTRIVIAVDIGASSVFGWRTAREQAASPNSMQVAMDQSNSGPVMLNPPDRTRMALRAERNSMTDDLLALLRRKHAS